jgi:protein-S-isoprenylcysteine O-methyltransferase Ste14
LSPFPIIGLSVALGAGSLALFGWFLFAGPPASFDLGLREGWRLAFDAALCLAFFLQHSLMVRERFRRRLGRRVAAAYHGALYSIASGAVLLALVVLWQEAGVALISFQGLPRVILRAIFLVAVLGFAWGAWALGSPDTFGVRALAPRSRRQSAAGLPLVARGPYRWVRHPLYLFALFLIWSYPDLSADRLLFNLSWTVWIVIGARLEERDLVAAFGEPYRAYQRDVPMLVPFGTRVRGPKRDGS